MDRLLFQRSAWSSAPLVLLLAACGVTDSRLPSATAPIVPEAAIEELFSELGPKTPGAAVAVLRGSQVVFAGGYGTADLSTSAPVSSSTVFSLASVSKHFTAFAALLLEEDGRLSLDDEVREYIPELPDYGTPITLREMVGHTSGLRSVLQLLGMTGLNPSDTITEEQVHEMVLRQKRLNFVPGERFSYSNSGYVLLAEVVERASGVPFAEFTRQRILEPLGMNDSFVMTDPGESVEGLARSYSFDGTSYTYVPADYSYGGSTGLFTTLDDLAKWVANLDDPIEEHRALSRMEEVVSLNDGSATNYAMGLFVDQRNGQRFVHHAGSDAGYVAFVARFPEQDLAVALLANTTAINAQARALAVAELFLAAPPLPESAPPAAASTSEVTELSAEQMALHTGHYLDRTNYIARHVVERDGSLLYRRPEQGGRETVLEALGPAEFRMAGAPEVLVVFGGEPGARRMNVVVGGEVEESFEEVSSLSLAARQLEALGGRYRSEELDVEYELAAAEGMLSVRVPRVGVVRLQAVGGDGFVGPGYPFQFLEWTREDGKIRGFTISSDRARGVAFERVPAGE